MEELEKPGGQGEAEKRESQALNKSPGCGSAWLERLVWDQEVAGSIPVICCLKPLENQGFFFFVLYFVLHSSSKCPFAI